MAKLKCMWILLLFLLVDSDTEANELQALQSSLEYDKYFLLFRNDSVVVTVSNSSTSVVDGKANDTHKQDEVHKSSIVSSKYNKVIFPTSELPFEDSSSFHDHENSYPEVSYRDVVNGHTGVEKMQYENPEVVTDNSESASSFPENHSVQRKLVKLKPEVMKKHKEIMNRDEDLSKVEETSEEENEKLGNHELTRNSDKIGDSGVSTPPSSFVFFTPVDGLQKRRPKVILETAWPQMPPTTTYLVPTNFYPPTQGFYVNQKYGARINPHYMYDSKDNYPFIGSPEIKGDKFPGTWRPLTLDEIEYIKLGNKNNKTKVDTDSVEIITQNPISIASTESASGENKLFNVPIIPVREGPMVPSPDLKFLRPELYQNKASTTNPSFNAVVTTTVKVKYNPKEPRLEKEEQPNYPTTDVSHKETNENENGKDEIHVESKTQLEKDISSSEKPNNFNKKLPTDEQLNQKVEKDEGEFKTGDEAVQNASIPKEFNFTGSFETIVSNGQRQEFPHERNFYSHHFSTIDPMDQYYRNLYRSGVNIRRNRNRRVHGEERRTPSNKSNGNKQNTKGDELKESHFGDEVISGRKEETSFKNNRKDNSGQEDKYRPVPFPDELKYRQGTKADSSTTEEYKIGDKHITEKSMSVFPDDEYRALKAEKERVLTAVDGVIYGRPENEYTVISPPTNLREKNTPIYEIMQRKTNFKSIPSTTEQLPYQQSNIPPVNSQHRLESSSSPKDVNEHQFVQAAPPNTNEEKPRYEEERHIHKHEEQSQGTTENEIDHPHLTTPNIIQEFPNVYDKNGEPHLNPQHNLENNDDRLINHGSFQIRPPSQDEAYTERVPPNIYRIPENDRTIPMRHVFPPPGDFGLRNVNNKRQPNIIHRPHQVPHDRTPADGHGFHHNNYPITRLTNQDPNQEQYLHHRRNPNTHQEFRPNQEYPRTHHLHINNPQPEFSPNQRNVLPKMPQHHVHPPPQDHNIPESINLQQLLSGQTHNLPGNVQVLILNPDGTLKNHQHANPLQQTNSNLYPYDEFQFKFENTFGMPHPPGGDLERRPVRPPPIRIKQMELNHHHQTQTYREPNLQQEQEKAPFQIQGHHNFKPHFHPHGMFGMGQHFGRPGIEQIPEHQGRLVQLGQNMDQTGRIPNLPRDNRPEGRRKNIMLLVVIDPNSLSFKRRKSTT